MTSQDGAESIRDPVTSIHPPHIRQQVLPLKTQKKKRWSIRSDGSRAFFFFLFGSLATSCSASSILTWQLLQTTSWQEPCNKERLKEPIIIQEQPPNKCLHNLKSWYSSHHIRKQETNLHSQSHVRTPIVIQSDMSPSSSYLQKNELILDKQNPNGRKNTLELRTSWVLMNFFNSSILDMTWDRACWLLEVWSSLKSMNHGNWCPSRHCFMKNMCRILQEMFVSTKFGKNTLYPSEHPKNHKNRQNLIRMAFLNKKRYRFIKSVLTHFAMFHNKSHIESPSEIKTLKPLANEPNLLEPMASFWLMDLSKSETRA